MPQLLRNDIKTQIKQIPKAGNIDAFSCNSCLRNRQITFLQETYFSVTITVLVSIIYRKLHTTPSKVVFIFIELFTKS